MKKKFEIPELKIVLLVVEDIMNDSTDEDLWENETPEW